MITRRLALFRIAATTAVAATGAAPVVVAAVQPKSPENPDLVRLGRHLARLASIHDHRTAELAKARAAYDADCPALPGALRATGYSRRFMSFEQQCDLDGSVMWTAVGKSHLPSMYHTVENIRRALEELPAVTEDMTDAEKFRRDYLMEILPIAERYEQDVETAMDRHGVVDAAERLHWAGRAISVVVERIAAIPAVTPEGITIKAQAYEVVSKVKDYRGHANFLIAPSLAADVCRVLSEGEIDA